MPLDTIVASWRLMIDRSPSLMRFAHGSSISDDPLSAMSRTTMFLAFS